MIRSGLVGGALAVLGIVGLSGFTQARAPTIDLVSGSVAIGGAPKGFGGSATLRVRFCGHGGARAVLRIRERATTGGRLVARRTFHEPLGTDLTDSRSYSCVGRFLVKWLIPSRFLRGRVYSVAVQLRDGRGQVTRFVGFDFRL